MLWFLVAVTLLRFGSPRLLDEYLSTKSALFTYSYESERLVNGSLYDAYVYKFAVTQFEYFNIVYSNQMNCYVPVLPVNHTLDGNVLVLLKSNSEFSSEEGFGGEVIISKVNSLGRIVCELFVFPDEIAELVVPGQRERSSKGKKDEGMEVLASTMIKYLKSNDSQYLFHFQIVKATIQSLNIVEDVFKNNVTSQIRFVLSGEGLLNGYNCYLASVLDSRVDLIIPRRVELGLRLFINDTWRQHCFFCESLEYLDSYGIVYELYNSYFDELSLNVDPLEYFSDADYMKGKEFDSKIFILLSTGDEFWTTFNTKSNYYNLMDAVGHRNNQGIYLRYFRNEGNSISEIEEVVFTTFSVFGDTAFDNFPKVVWSNPLNNTLVYTEDNYAHVNISFERIPDYLSVVYAENSITYDFRLSEFGKNWHYSSQTPAVFLESEVAGPENGWMVFYYYFGWNDIDLGFSSQAFALPQTYPCSTPPQNFLDDPYIWVTLLGVLGFLVLICVCCVVCYGISFSYENIYLKVRDFVTSRNPESKRDYDDLSKKLSGVKATDFIKLDDDEEEEGEVGKDKGTTVTLIDGTHQEVVGKQTLFKKESLFPKKDEGLLVEKKDEEFLEEKSAKAIEKSEYTKI